MKPSVPASAAPATASGSVPTPVSIASGPLPLSPRTVSQARGQPKRTFERSEGEDEVEGKDRAGINGEFAKGANEGDANTGKLQVKTEPADGTGHGDGNEMEVEDEANEDEDGGGDGDGDEDGEFLPTQR
jgi:hypothetical protein